MDTYIAYFDESGDDGPTTASSDFFILTSLYMNMENWQKNYKKIRECRRELKEKYGFHVTEELHTKHLLTDKKPYRNYGWTIEQKQEIILSVTNCIAHLDAKIVNVIIDKTHIRDGNYPVLENALKYNIGRIEKDSNGKWNYLLITDKGRLGSMRKTARAIRAYNPIRSKFTCDYTNQPVKNMIEDILEKDSKESYFIQVSDFISYIINLYYKTQIKKETFPSRVGNVIDNIFINCVMEILNNGGIFNLKANSQNRYGLVIYPKA